jgi:hypothetical protein
MLLKDIDNKLDTECKLVFNKDDRVFSLSKAMGHTFLGFLNVKEKDKILTVYIPKTDLEPTNKTMGLRITSEEMEGFTVANVPIEKSIYELLFSLDKVASTSTFVVSVEKGFMTVRFRFHHSFLPQLSTVLAGSEILKHMVKDINISPSEGFISFLCKTNEEFPLYILEYEAPLSIWENEEVISIFRKGGIGELADYIAESPKPKLIIYGTSESGSVLGPIVPDSFIYEAVLNSDMIAAMNTILETKGVHSYNVFFKVANDKLRITVFVNKHSAVRHIDEVFSFYSRAGVPITLLLSRDLSDELLEEI